MERNKKTGRWVLVIISIICIGLLTTRDLWLKKSFTYMYASRGLSFICSQDGKVAFIGVKEPVDESKEQAEKKLGTKTESFVVIGPNMKLPEGIGVGSDRQVVFKALGQPDVATFEYNHPGILSALISFLTAASIVFGVSLAWEKFHASSPKRAIISSIGFGYLFLLLTLLIASPDVLKLCWVAITQPSTRNLLLDDWHRTAPLYRILWLLSFPPIYAIKGGFWGASLAFSARVTSTDRWKKYWNKIFITFIFTFLVHIVWTVPTSLVWLKTRPFPPLSAVDLISFWGGNFFNEGFLTSILLSLFLLRSMGYRIWPEPKLGWKEVFRNDPSL